MEYEYMVTLHGNKEKLKWAEGVIEAATFNTSTEMEDFLQEYDVSVPQGYEDVNCYHLFLLTILFCRADEKEVVVGGVSSGFLSGCKIIRDGVLEVHCRIAGDGDGFFNSLVEHSDYLEFYTIGEECTVTLHGNAEKLRWAENIIERAIKDTSSEIGNFLVEYGITVSDFCFDVSCNALILLVYLFCKEGVEENFSNDTFYDFLVDCSLQNGALRLICRISGDLDGFFISLVNYSDFLQSYKVEPSEYK